MSIGIKPCPFCGSKDVKVVRVKEPVYGTWVIKYWVACNACKETGPQKGTDVAAIEAWNLTKGA